MDEAASQQRGWAVWVTGLPGSGKSALARGLCRALARRLVPPPEHLQMDERRKAYFPQAAYSPEDRIRAYAMFVDEAAALAGRGLGVVMDGSAPLLSMRSAARSRISRFAEIHVKCDLEEAMRREAFRPEGLVMAGLYAKALERRRTGTDIPGLGQVIGVDIPFEEDPHAECVIDNTRLSKAETLDAALAFMDRWLELHG